MVLQQFYDLHTVLRDPSILGGEWRLLDCMPAWDGNWAWDCYIACCWEGGCGKRTFVVVNYAANQSQCYVHLPWPDLAGHPVHLQDLLSSASYDRDENSLISTGLYLDLPPWGRHAFCGRGNSLNVARNSPTNICAGVIRKT